MGLTDEWEYLQWKVQEREDVAEEAFGGVL